MDPPTEANNGCRRMLHASGRGSFAQSCLTVCDQVGYCTTGLPVLHRLPELIQTHVH